MDKEQKQLIRTYFRKRNIATNTGSGEYAGYELDFGVRNNIINPNDIKLNAHGIVNLITKYPHLISYFENRLDELEGYNIVQILKKQPQLITYFKDRLNELDGVDISELLKSQPKLINYFKNILNDLYVTDISMILKNQPKLINYFKNRLNELDEDDISLILRFHRLLRKGLCGYPQIPKI